MGRSSSIIIKLKFLGVVSAPEVDSTPIIKDSITYNRWKFWKVFSLIKFLRELSLKINEIRQMDFKDTPENKECRIKRPQNIDLIPFSAMIEVQQYFGNTEGSEVDIEELVCNVISLVCYSTNNSQDFDSSSESYKEFKEYVSNSDLVHMMGLFKWIEESLTKSTALWGERFKEIQTIDKDYEAAGGSRMEQFNVLNTIKSTATDFNVPYKEAMLLPYGMTQANSLAKATSNHIQGIMTKIVEARMKQERALTK